MSSTTGYPYLTYARQRNTDYGVLLAYADVMRKDLMYRAGRDCERYDHWENAAIQKLAKRDDFLTINHDVTNLMRCTLRDKNVRVAK